MPSLKMSLCIRIRAKVNKVQNNKTIDKHPFLCHLMTIKYPLNSLKPSKMYFRYMWHLKHDLDKNLAYVSARLKVI